MESGRRYSLLFSALTIVLVVGVLYSIGGLSSNARHSQYIVPMEGGDTFVVKDPALIRPTAASYAAFAADDSAWRKEFAKAITIREMSAGGEWRPSLRQMMQDRVFLLTREGRTAEAVLALESWMAGNPDDMESLLELARLTVALERYDDALGHYRVLLARAPTVQARAEFAAVLLNTKRYADAEREYRALIAMAPANVEYRLGLARALAWGEKWREAETVLVWLRDNEPGDTSIVAMLRSARLAMNATSDEAGRWVAEDAQYLPYRLVFARALIAEKRYREGLAQYDTILVSTPTIAMFVETSGAYATAGDSIGARIIGRAVAMAPGDTALRARYARVLAWSGDRFAAIDQWTRLITQSPENAEFHLERGRLYSWANDFPRAERDLRESARLRPSYEALSMLGDIYRWGGDYKRAKSAYAQALALRPGDPMVLASLAEIRRIEGMVYAFGPSSEDRGWNAVSRYAEDNSGFLFLSAGLSRGFAFNRHWVFSLSGEQRYIAQRSWRDATRWVRGIAGSARISYARQSVMLAAHAGMARHALVRDIPTGGISAVFQGRALRGSLELGTGPVYSSLMTTHALVQFAPTSGVAQSVRPLIARTATGTVAVPIGPGEITVGADQMWFSDGNRRTSLSGGVRLPINRHVSAVYYGNNIGYARSSDVYWDPRRYQSHSVGVEVAVRRPRGLSVAARVLPGIARAAETFPLAADSSIAFRPRSVTQLSAGGELEYRQQNWAVFVGGGYGRGREGGYEAVNGTLRVQLGW